MPARSIARSTIAASLIMLAGVSVRAQQSAEEEILQTTRSWVKSVSLGDRDGMNAIMDAEFLAVTPAGDIVPKQRLVPDDPEKAVPKLPPFELDRPIVHLYGGAAVVMTRLTTPDVSQTLNATFVYNKSGSAWKLVALHVSPVGD